MINHFAVLAIVLAYPATRIACRVSEAFWSFVAQCVAEYGQVRIHAEGSN